MVSVKVDAGDRGGLRADENLILVSELDAGAEKLTAALELSRAVHDVRLESLARAWLAVAECFRGAMDAARATGDRAVALAPDAVVRAIVTFIANADRTRRTDLTPS